MPVTPDDLAVYLGVDLDDTQVARAAMLIDDAVGQALAVVTVGVVPDDGPTEANLPAGWEGVVRPAVARIFLNPTGVTSEVTGPYSVGRPATTGALLSKNERAALRRLAGRSGGAFTIDGLPDEYCPRVESWDVDAEASCLP